MGGILDSLSVGGSALLAHQRGMQISGHNIANASTEGFHRQEITTIANSAPSYGVRATDARRITDRVLGGRILEQQADSAFADARAAELTRLESSLGPIGEGGLSESLSALFSEFRSLAAAPDDLAVRGAVLAQAEDLSASVRGAAGALEQAQRDADGAVAGHVETVNGLLERVASLNATIGDTEAGTETALDLRDQRDLTVRQLAELAGATSFEDGRGLSTVLVSGITVVQGGEHRPLGVRPNATTGLNDLFVTQGTEVDLNGLRAGRVGGLLAVRDDTLPAFRDSLDNFAFDLATAFNAVHAAGFGLDGVGGRDFFAAPSAVSGAAELLSVDASVRGAPEAIAAALDPAAVPGDPRGADALVGIESALVAAGGTQTLAGSLGSLFTSAGQLVQGAEQQAVRAEEQLGYLDELRESQSGVSIEEQMLALNRYQRGFQAASRVITAVDEMLEDLLRM